MPLVNAKCTNCGAALIVDDDKEAAVCKYCDSAFIVEKAINNYNITNNINANVVNIYNQSNNSSNSDFLIESGKLLRYKGKSQEVVIPEEVFIIGDSAFKNTGVKKVIFHRGIVSIEKSPEEDSAKIRGAFSGCYNLEEIQIAGVKEIPERTFDSCPNLRTVILHEGVEVIGKRAFESCKNLTTVLFPNTLKRIEIWAFGWCEGLREIVIPRSVQYVACQSFESCKNLEKVVIEDGARTIHGGAFFGCYNISSIHYPKSVHIENLSHLIGAKYNITAEDPELLKRITDLRTNKGGCYVATAVYGSYDCAQVWTLRRYRDNVLSKSWYGKLFVKVYYATSPTFVKLLGETKWFNRICRPRLDKIVKRLNDLGIEDTPYKDNM